MSGSVLWLSSPTETGRRSSVLLRQFMSERKRRTNWGRSSGEWSCGAVLANGYSVSSSLVAAPRSSEQVVHDVVLKQAALVGDTRRKRVAAMEVSAPMGWNLLNEAYDRCGKICAEYAKTFYLGTLLMTPERRRAIWAIYGMLLYLFISETFASGIIYQGLVNDSRESKNHFTCYLFINIRFSGMISLIE